MADETMQLDDNQLLVLSTMVYRLDRAGDIQLGDTLASVAGAMREAVVGRMLATEHSMDDNLSQLMSYRDWLLLLDHVSASPQLAGLVVNAFDIDEAGAKKILLSDGGGNAYAVFGGTGAGEWKDNVEAAYQATSVQQQRAFEWLRAQLADRAYASVVATGHSKGGNKAMYIAVREGALIDRVVAFDAQGFSREFVELYGPGILENTSKITQYSLDNDYVNGLLACIALPSRRIFIDGSHVENPAAYHSPFSMFHPYHGSSGSVLELAGSVPQGRFGKVFKEFSLFVHQNAEGFEFRQICECLGLAFENLLAPHVSDSDRAARSLEIAQSEGFGLLVEYLGRFFMQNVQGVTVADVLGLLLPMGKRGRTVFDDLKLGALETVSSVLKYLTR